MKATLTIDPGEGGDVVTYETDDAAELCIEREDRVPDWIGSPDWIGLGSAPVAFLRRSVTLSLRLPNGRYEMRRTFGPISKGAAALAEAEGEVNPYAAALEERYRTRAEAVLRATGVLTESD